MQTLVINTRYGGAIEAPIRRSTANMVIHQSIVDLGWEGHSKPKLTKSYTVTHKHTNATLAREFAKLRNAVAFANELEAIFDFSNPSLDSYNNESMGRKILQLISRHRAA